MVASARASSTKEGGDETSEDPRNRQGSARPTSHEFLYVVLEADRPLAGGARFVLDEIDEVIIARGRERSVRREISSGVRRLTLHLPSARTSSVHARLRREAEGWVLLDAGSRNGTYVNGERVERCVPGAADVIEVGRTFLTLRAADTSGNAAALDFDSEQGSSQSAALGFATLLPPLSSRIAELQRIAASDISVVLCGESGVGKDTLAQAIHDSSRPEGPFIAVNCGALGDALDLVRAANGGTLLLDDVGDLAPPAQAALLRVLEQRALVPGGSTQAHEVDVRVVATTQEPLDRAVRKGRLRPDLLARLAGFTCTLPPLRERREDLGLLIAALLRDGSVASCDQPTIALEFAHWLLRHDWPANVRELEQLLRRAAVLADGEVFDLPALDALHESDPTAQGRPARAATSSLPADDQALRQRLVDELVAANGNVAQVSRALGKAPMQVRRWLRRFALDPGTFRSGRG